VRASTTCSDLSLAAGEPLAGTATQGTDWLLVEVRGPWGRDAVADSGLQPALRDRLTAYPGKVVLIRRPDRRVGGAVIRAEVREGDGRAIRYDRVTLDRDALPDLANGETIDGPVFLVCTHGRRDACCARLGAPVYEALARYVPPERVWQASHLGGHRFAPNVVVLPHGIQLGRIPLDRVEEVVDTVTAGRIPLDLYRGRTIYPPKVQAAEVAVRAATGCDELAGIALAVDDGERVTFCTRVGDVTVQVEHREGPPAPASCGAEYESPVLWVTSLESGA